MSQQRLRVGLIGAGRIGRVHAEVLAHQVDDAEVTVVVDVSADAASSCAEWLRIARWSTDEAEAFGDDVDAVVIASATNTHARLIEEAARAGKAIFCEKPVDLDLARIDRALQAADAAGVPLQIGFNRRFDPNFRHVREVVASGGIGTPHLLRITSRDPAPPPIEYVKVSGGMFFDMTIHDFDMARYLMGSEVVSVFAAGAVRVDPAIGEAGDIDTAVVTLQFENGAIGTIDNSRQAVYGYDQRVEVFGSEGVIAADNNTPHRTVHGTRTGMHHPLPLHFFMDRYTASYAAELASFVRAVRTGTPCEVNGTDGRVPVVIGKAAMRSLAEGRVVKLTEVE